MVCSFRKDWRWEAREADPALGRVLCWAARDVVCVHVSRRGCHCQRALLLTGGSLSVLQGCARSAHLQAGGAPAVPRERGTPATPAVRAVCCHVPSREAARRDTDLPQPRWWLGPWARADWGRGRLPGGGGVDLNHRFGFHYLVTAGEVEVRKEAAVSD